MPGTVIIKPIQAHLDTKEKLFRSYKPFCVVIIGNHCVASEVCKRGGKSPSWEEALAISRTNEPYCYVEVMHKGLLRDKVLGVCEIDLNELMAMKCLQRWYTIYYEKEPTGEILVDATFPDEDCTEQHIVYAKKALTENDVRVLPARSFSIEVDSQCGQKIKMETQEEREMKRSDSKKSFTSSSTERKNEDEQVFRALPDRYPFSPRRQNMEITKHYLPKGDEDPLFIRETQTTIPSIPEKDLSESRDLARIQEEYVQGYSISQKEPLYPDEKILDTEPMYAANEFSSIREGQEETADRNGKKINTLTLKNKEDNVSKNRLAKWERPIEPIDEPSKEIGTQDTLVDIVVALNGNQDNHRSNKNNIKQEVKNSKKKVIKKFYKEDSIPQRDISKDEKINLRDFNLGENIDKENNAFFGNTGFELEKTINDTLHKSNNTGENKSQIQETEPENFSDESKSAVIENPGKEGHHQIPISTRVNASQDKFSDNFNMQNNPNKLMSEAPNIMIDESTKHIHQTKTGENSIKDSMFSLKEYKNTERQPKIKKAPKLEGHYYVDFDDTKNIPKRLLVPSEQRKEINSERKYTPKKSWKNPKLIGLTSPKHKTPRNIENKTQASNQKLLFSDNKNSKEVRSKNEQFQQYKKLAKEQLGTLSNKVDTMKTKLTSQVQKAKGIPKEELGHSTHNRNSHDENFESRAIFDKKAIAGPSSARVVSLFHQEFLKDIKQVQRTINENFIQARQKTKPVVRRLYDNINGNTLLTRRQQKVGQLSAGKTETLKEKLFEGVDKPPEILKERKMNTEQKRSRLRSENEDIAYPYLNDNHHIDALASINKEEITQIREMTLAKLNEKRNREQNMQVEEKEPSRHEGEAENSSMLVRRLDERLPESRADNFKNSLRAEVQHLRDKSREKLTLFENMLADKDEKNAKPQHTYEIKVYHYDSLPKEDETLKQRYIERRDEIKRSPRVSNRPLEELQEKLSEIEQLHNFPGEYRSPPKRNKWFDREREEMLKSEEQRSKGYLSNCENSTFTGPENQEKLQVCQIPLFASSEEKHDFKDLKKRYLCPEQNTFAIRKKLQAYDDIKALAKTEQESKSFPQPQHSTQEQEFPFKLKNENTAIMKNMKDTNLEDRERKILGQRIPEDIENYNPNRFSIGGS